MVIMPQREAKPHPALPPLLPGPVFPRCRRQGPGSRGRGAPRVSQSNSARGFL